MSPRARRLLPFAVLLAASLPFLPSLRHGFVFDDLLLIVNNPALDSPTLLRDAFSQDLDALARASEQVQSNYYRPLLVLLLGALHAAFGVQPAGWHAVVVALHALAGLLAFLVLERAGLDRPAAGLGAVAFAWHPAHVDSVAWATGLQDVVAGLAGLLAFLAYLAWSERPGAARLAGLSAVFALGLLVKESLTGLLVLVLLDVLLRRGRASLPALGALGAVTIAYLGVRLAVLGAFARAFPTAPPLPTCLANVPVALLAYLRMVLWPFGLGLLSPERPLAPLSGQALAAAGAVVLLLLAGAVWARRQPAALFPLLWFVAWLAPSLNLRVLNPEWMIVDRYLYLALLALPWALLACGGRAGRWVVLGLGLAWGGTSLITQRVYENEAIFWAWQVRADPASSTAWAERGRLLAEAGQNDEARAALARAIELDSGSLLPRLRLGNLAFREGRAGEAASLYREAVQRNPGYLPAWRNLPVALAAAGQTEAAIEAGREAARRFPRDPDLLLNLGGVLRNAGRGPEALVALQAGRVAAPQDGRLALREAQLLLEMGQREQARHSAEEARALARDPGLRAAADALLASLP